MRIVPYLSAAALGLSVGLVVAPKIERTQQPADKLTSTTLRNMLQSMGYDTKVIGTGEGKEKYEISLKTATFELPIDLEVSGSTNYVWLSSLLGENKPTRKHEDLLKENFNIQPTFFYITASNNLMAAQAIDNRVVAPAILRRAIDKFVSDLDKTSKVWGDQP